MAPDSQNTDSLHDFLYVDRDRLNSFSAQLFRAGVLASTKTVDQTSSQSGGQFGIPGTNVTGGSGTLSSLEHMFDASHTLAINVLDKLDERGFIRQSLAGANLGDIFYIEGRIRFLDYRILQNCWEAIQGVMIADQQAKGQHLKSAEKANLKNNFKLIQALPHMTELTLYTATDSIWTSLNPNYLRVEPASLAFAHGTVVPGSWSMIAALDARPSSSEEALNEQLIGQPASTEFQSGMCQAMEAMRTFLGRPQSAYAATPLLIFRTINPAADSGVTLE